MGKGPSPRLLTHAAGFGNSRKRCSQISRATRCGNAMSSAKCYRHAAGAGTAPEGPGKPSTIARGLESRRSNLCPFLVKLWSMVNDKEEPAIRWSCCTGGAGASNVFTIVDEARFRKVTLPRYFRSSRLASFKRQLNYFGFHSLGHGRAMSFSNPHFRPSDKAALMHIRRRTQIAGAGPAGTGTGTCAYGVRLDGGLPLQAQGAPTHQHPKDSSTSGKLMTKGSSTSGKLMTLRAPGAFPNDPGLTPITPMPTVSFAALCSSTTRNNNHNSNSNNSKGCDSTLWSWSEDWD